jgi:DNA-binding transcriptional LysR family regulator
MGRSRIAPRQLDAFLAVAEHRSFTAAAQHLALTPSAVSQLINELETTIGFRLFDRSTRKVTLTAAAREFAAPAQTALRHMKLVENAAADLRNRSVGIVRIAAPQVLASTILPKALRAYRDVRPRVALRIRDARVEELGELVANAEVDIAVGPDRTTDDEVRRELLFTSPWMLWCSREHPLAKCRLVSWTRLREFPVVAAGRDHEQSLAHLRGDSGFEGALTPIDIVQNMTTALGIAAVNGAVTLSPAYVRLMAKSFGLVSRKLIEPEVNRAISLFTPAGRAASPAAQGVAEFLIQWIQAQTDARAL